jgi:hypothetical protein
MQHVCFKNALSAIRLPVAREYRRLTDIFAQFYLRLWNAFVPVRAPS